MIRSLLVYECPVLQDLVNAGLRIMRINFSHATFEEAGFYALWNSGDHIAEELLEGHALVAHRRLARDLTESKTFL